MIGMGLSIPEIIIHQQLYRVTADADFSRVTADGEDRVTAESDLRLYSEAA